MHGSRDENQFYYANENEKRNSICEIISRELYLKNERFFLWHIIPDVYPLKRRFIYPPTSFKARSMCVAGNFVFALFNGYEPNPLMTLLRIKRVAFDVP